MYDIGVCLISGRQTTLLADDRRGVLYDLLKIYENVESKLSLLQMYWSVWHVACSCLSPHLIWLLVDLHSSTHGLWLQATNYSTVNYSATSYSTALKVGDQCVPLIMGLLLCNFLHEAPNSCLHMPFIRCFVLSHATGTSIPVWPLGW